MPIRTHNFGTAGNDQVAPIGWDLRDAVRLYNVKTTSKTDLIKMPIGEVG